MGYLLQSFFLGAGGLARFIFFQFLNVLFDKKFSRDIEYYLSKENFKDKNGFSVPQKNFIAGILIFILTILIIEKIESNS